MATTRRRSTRRPAAVTLRSLGIPGMLELMVGWCPPRNAFEQTRSDFTSYAEYLHTYRSVRDEAIVRWPDPQSFFAERLHLACVAQPRADVEVLGETLYRNTFDFH